MPPVAAGPTFIFFLFLEVAVFSSLRAVLIGTVTVALLSACAGGAATTSVPAQGPATTSRHTARFLSAVKKTAETLYILHGAAGKGISVYKNGGKKFLRTLQATPNSNLGMVVDPSGLLYVGSVGHGGRPPGTLSVYSNQGSKLIRSFSQRNSFVGLAIDQQGNLYSSCPKHICERANAKPPITHKFEGGTLPLAVDLHGNVATFNCFKFGAEACVFAPGERTPSWKITNGVYPYYVYQLGFDPSGSLYVANYGTTTPNDPGNVAVYAPSATSPTRVITDGVTWPISIAIDSVGTLYVYSNCGGPISGNHCGVNSGAVTVYNAGESTPSRTITDGVKGCDATVWPFRGSCLAVDNAGDIYIANSGIYGNVVEYRPGSDTPYLTINDSGYPVAVAVGS